MHPKDGMTEVIRGKRFSVGTATLLASDEYWDGHNMERRGRNTFLYRTKGGAFFQVKLTQWQGERDTIIPLTRKDAMELWEHLPERFEEYEDAFEVVVEEAAAPGRPPLFDEPMRQTAVWLPETMIAWLKEQHGTMSDTMRGLIQAAMDKAD